MGFVSESFIVFVSVIFQASGLYHFAYISCQKLKFRFYLFALFSLIKVPVKLGYYKFLFWHACRLKRCCLMMLWKAQDRDQWRVLVNMGMNRQVP
jgi:hypothetical protein